MTASHVAWFNGGMTATRPLSGYQTLIADAIGSTDPAMLALTESFMRDTTGGALDNLDRGQFARLARSCRDEIVEWHMVGQVGGMTLAAHCAILVLECPAL